MKTAEPSPGPIFSWIRDQDEVLLRLRAAVRADRVAQAYLFHGPPGVGKTRAALGLAQALNCVAADGPCGSCRPCRKVAGLIHPDVRLLFPSTREEDSQPEDLAKRLADYGADRYDRLDYARNASIGIDRIRELKAEAAKSLAEGRRRVYILCGANRMLEEAAQSALKLIEEPPPDTHLILVAEEPAALLPTIVSRCQQVRFRALPRRTIEEILISEGKLEGNAARLIASLSNGSLGRALDLKDERSIVRTRDAVVELMQVRPDAAQIRESVRQEGARWDPSSARRHVELLLMWCHDLLAIKYGLGEDCLSNPDRKGDIEKQARELDVGRIREWIDALEEMVEAIERNVNPSLALHEALLRFSSPAGTAPRPGV